MTSLSEILENFDQCTEFTVPPEWSQGRTVYGGLSTALALQAALAEAKGELPPLKSAQVAFAGPAAGALRFRPQILRRGKSATFISVDCLDGSDICTRVGFVFAEPRPSQVQHSLYVCPEIGPPDAYKPFNPGGRAPASIGNFDLRPCTDTLPFSGASYPELIAWVRHRDASNVDPAVALVALADSLPPAAISTITQMVPFSSMTWTLDLPRPARANEWHLMRSTSRRAGDGYSYQTMEIWDDARDLILSGSQSVAVFG